MEQTYDPILRDWDLPRLRFSALAPPRLGTALVLVPGRGDLLRVDAGRAVPGARLGHYRTCYLIDTAEHVLAIPVQLPSSDSAFVFQSVIHCGCRIAVPEEVARRQLHDVGTLIRSSVRARLRSASALHDIADGARAESALAKALREVRFDPALGVTGEYIEIPVHADEAGESRRLREAARFERVNAIAAGPLQHAIASGIPAILARHLSAHPEDTGHAVEMLAAGEMVESEQMLRAIRLVVGGKDEEAFETWDARKALMDRFVARVSGGGSGLFESRTRGSLSPGGGGSRVRGALPSAAREAEPAAAVIDGSVVDGSVVDGSVAGGREAPRRSRVVLGNGGGRGRADGGCARRVARDPDLEDGD